MDLITGFSIITAEQAIKHIHPLSLTLTHTHKLTLPCSCTHTHTHMHDTHTCMHIQHLKKQCTCHILDVFTKRFKICTPSYACILTQDFFLQNICQSSFNKQSEVLPKYSANFLLFFSYKASHAPLDVVLLTFGSHTNSHNMIYK